jgi:pyruvate formate lyase activating enzyme
MLDDGRMRCDLCPRHCQLKTGQRGFCFVRQAGSDQISLTSYGRASGFCIDPIEKKPLNHFYPGSSVLSFGTAGCNLGCRFCQNWHISKASQHDRLTDTASPQDIVHAAKANGCRSLAFTYNDPVIFAEYAMDCAEVAKAQDVKTVAVTAGYITAKARPAFFKNIDAANVDLKAFSDEFYRRQCYGALEPVLDTLRWLTQETSTWVEVTTLLIEGLNTDAGELERMFAWFLDNLGPDVPLHLTAFHPDFKLQDIPPTSKARLLNARKRAMNMGLKYVYTGNVHSPETQSTLCSKCGATLIGRRGYAIESWSLRTDSSGNAQCLECSAPVAGNFAASQEEFGNRRIRLPTFGPN